MRKRRSGAGVLGRHGKVLSDSTVSDCCGVKLDTTTIFQNESRCNRHTLECKVAQSVTSSVQQLYSTLHTSLFCLCATATHNGHVQRSHRHYDVYEM